eukprot:515448_1
MATLEDEWISLSDTNTNQVVKPIYVGDSNILYHAIQANKLVAYNIDNHKWTDFIEYPPEFHCVCPVMALDDSKQKLFIYGEESFMIVDMKTKDIKIMIGVDSVGGRNSSAVLAHDKFHIFGGGRGEDKHYIFNEGNKKMDVIHQFAGVFDGGFSFQQTIYLPQKDVIFLIGGFGDCTCDSSDEIYYYDHKSWKLFDLKLPVGLDAFGCVVTRNEKYIILFGGDDTFGHMRDIIIIIDLENMTIHESSVRCPLNAQFDAVLVDCSIRNQILVNGYVRWCWTLSGCKDIGCLCVDVINLIVMWYNEEYVYLKEKYNTRHWKIQLTKILADRN